MVKKVGGAFLKIVHEKYRAKVTEEQGVEHSLFVDQMETITDTHPGDVTPPCLIADMYLRNLSVFFETSRCFSILALVVMFHNHMLPPPPLTYLFDTYPLSDTELKPHTIKSTELLTPIRAFNILTKVQEEDAMLLWMNSSFGRPDSLIMWTVPVPPVPIRPSVPQEMGGGSTEDDITIKLQEIIEMNNALKVPLSFSY